jgi:glycosyltransferase involved in cell wall biosynthesis
MVGHLRSEKSPETLFATASLLIPSDKIFIDHIGDGLDEQLAQQAQTTASQNPHYRWLGGMPHTATRRAVQRAHVLVHTSRMEGGAHVIMEAAASGTPVLASRIDGNVGMLGADYEGYFEWGNAAQLAQLLRECRRTQVDENGLLARLGRQCAARAVLFEPAKEQGALMTLMQALE